MLEERSPRVAADGGDDQYDQANRNDHAVINPQDDEIHIDTNKRDVTPKRSISEDRQSGLQPSAFNSITRVLPKDLLSNKESEYKDVSVRAIREEQ